MPYSYTNREGKTYYFRAVPTKKGSLRYYKTSSQDFEDLIEEIPKGYEVTEKPYDAMVIIRKIKKNFIRQEEKEILYDAIEEFSVLNDFFVHTEGKIMTLYYSQFNYIGGGIDGEEASLSREQAIEIHGEYIVKWMKFFDGFRLILVDKEKRLFQAERIINTGFFGGDYHPIGEVGKVKDLALRIAPHLGTQNWYRIPPRGYEEKGDIIL